MKRKHYLLTIVLSVVLSVMATNYLIAGSRANQPGVVTAKEFELVNENGDVVLRIGAMAQGYPGIVIRYGDKPGASMELFVFKDESVGFSVSVPEGKVSANLLLHDNKTVRSVFLELASERSRAEFGIKEDGEPYIKLTDKNGQIVMKAPQNAPEKRQMKNSSSQASDKATRN